MNTNKGEVWNENTRLWENDSAATDEQFARLCAHDWFDRGARILGGCCRTTPDTIACIVDALLERGRGSC